MDILSALLGGLILLLILDVIKKGLFSKRYKLPPGPFPWPIFGNCFQLDNTGPHKTFLKWGESSYGGIFKIKMFQETMVIVNDAKLIYEVLVERSSEFAGRPNFERINIFFRHESDLVFTTISPEWQVRKKLLLKSLRKYGDIAGALEEISYKAIDNMLLKIQRHQSKDHVFDLRPILHSCTSEIICSIVYGENYTDENLKRLLEIEKPTIEQLAPAAPNAYIDFLPFAKYLPTKHVKDFYEMTDENQSFFNEKLEDMKRVVDTNNPSCVSEEFIKFQKENKNLKDSEIQNMMMNVVYAGFATTTTTMYALVGVLLNMPEIQHNIYQEVCNVVGKRRPCLADRSKMPYTEACILEIGRYASILPNMVLHAAVGDTTLGGYDIPAGTTILPNVWGLHHDKNLWKDPFVFSPERFLEADGTLVGPDHPNRKNLLPFGAGRRVCAGEVLARNRMFLIVASLFQNFKFMEETPGMPPKYDPREYGLGIIMFPPEYQVRVQEMK